MTSTSIDKTIQTACVSCGHPWNSNFRFCPTCGSPSAAVVASKGDAPKTPRVTVTSKGALTIGLLALVMLAGGSGVQAVVHWKREDKRPKEKFVPQDATHGHGSAGQETEPVSDPVLDRLRSELKSDQNNVVKLKALAVRIGELLRDKPSAPSALALEAIDALSSVVKQTPEDPEALILMADVSFDQRAFDKAREFYDRYLTLAPQDLGARARYASTLTFLKRFDDAIGELQKVLTVDPNNFPAKAYLAITYAEKGDTAKAKELAQVALAAAPNAEARERFNRFVLSLDQRPIQGSSGETSETASRADASRDPVTQHIANHPIAGSKFVRAEYGEPGQLRILMKDFPMAVMPPMPKEKFSAGIKAKMSQDVTKVILVDEPTGETMAEIAR